MQAELRVGAAADHYELEADRVADAVVARIAAAPDDPRAGGSGGSDGPGTAHDDAATTPAVTGGAAPAIRRVSTGTVGEGGGIAAPEVEGALRSASGGQPLEPQVRRRMESAFDADFGAVRIHTGPAADQLTTSLGARAFTYGSSIFMGRGEFDPETPAGQRLLAHELTHVVQQGGNPTHVQRHLDGLLTMLGVFEEEGDEGTDQLDRVLQRIGTLVGSVDDLTGAAGTFHAGGVSATTGVSFKDATDFTSGPGASAGLGAVGIASGGTQLASGASQVRTGVANVGLAKGPDGDSLERNLGWQQIWSGCIDIVLGLANAVAGGVGIAGGQVPASNKPFSAGQSAFGAVVLALESARSTELTVEDSVAASRLGTQAKALKHEADHYLPRKLRKERFDQFLTDRKAYLDAKEARKHAPVKDWGRLDHRIRQAGSTLKSGDLERYEKLESDLRRTKGMTPNADDFFRHFLEKNEKEFGSGTPFRKKFEAALEDAETSGKRVTATGVRLPSDRLIRQYTGTAKLRDVATWAHRRKAESGSINALDAVGKGLDAGGTGAGDPATLIAGKVLQLASFAYVQTKSKVKLKKTVHEVAKVKDLVAYGGRTKRGFWWEMKVFLDGGLGGSAEQARKKLLKAVEATPEDAAKALDTKDFDQPSKADRKDAIKRLTHRSARKVGDFLASLESADDGVFERACKMLHVIAETNLAGHFAKIDDADLRRFNVRARRVSELKEAVATLQEDVKTLATDTPDPGAATSGAAASGASATSGVATSGASAKDKKHTKSKGTSKARADRQAKEAEKAEKARQTERAEKVYKLRKIEEALPEEEQELEAKRATIRAILEMQLSGVEAR
ncbi:MAG: DUF4157 domain-containing protein [Nitriliruptoraceae bacterium]|nr:DUF4157 domain-containing protein [Nitriliruptoraceae bacterium]